MFLYILPKIALSNVAFFPEDLILYITSEPNLSDASVALYIKRFVVHDYRKLKSTRLA